MKKQLEIRINSDGTIQIDRDDSELMEFFSNLLDGEEKEHLQRFFEEGGKIKKDKEKLKDFFGKIEDEEVKKLWDKSWCG